jgi:hypothetical protein
MIFDKQAEAIMRHEEEIEELKESLREFMKHEQEAMKERFNLEAYLSSPIGEKELSELKRNPQAYLVQSKPKKSKKKKA